jgi:hypothetical protein
MHVALGAFANTGNGLFAARSESGNGQRHQEQSCEERDERFIDSFHKFFLLFLSCSFFRVTIDSLTLHRAAVNNVNHCFAMKYNDCY